MPYAAILHSHVSSWFLVLVLFFVSFLLHRAGKAKGQKITHMILRLFYLLVLATGIGLVVSHGFSFSSIVKGLLAFWLLYIMEMILVRSVKGTLVKSGIYWLQFIIALVAVFYYGYVVIPS